jgi:hypothetical protein
MTALTNLGCSKRFTNLRNREASMLITVLSALMGVDVRRRSRRGWKLFRRWKHLLGLHSSSSRLCSSRERVGAKGFPGAHP